MVRPTDRHHCGEPESIGSQKNTKFPELDPKAFKSLLQQERQRKNANGQAQKAPPSPPENFLADRLTGPPFQMENCECSFLHS